MQFGACVPPITKLYELLARGGGFPLCSEGDVAKTKTHGKLGSAAYRVTMTYSDGSQQTYSLASINGPPVSVDTAAQSGAARP